MTVDKFKKEMSEKISKKKKKEISIIFNQVVFTIGKRGDIYYSKIINGLQEKRRPLSSNQKALQYFSEHFERMRLLFNKEL